MTRLTDSQTRAIKNWEANNKDKSNYIKSKSACKGFIKNKATKEDLSDIKQLILEIEKEKY